MTGIDKQSRIEHICRQVKRIYDWIDQQNNESSPDCSCCGRCCDFETFGHTLFVSTAEMIYLRHSLSPEKIKLMTGPKCPYIIGNKCSIRHGRFIGCRTFFCKADQSVQNKLSEAAIEKIKYLHTTLSIDYLYQPLEKALTKTDSFYNSFL